MRSYFILEINFKKIYMKILILLIGLFGAAWTGNFFINLDEVPARKQENYYVNGQFYYKIAMLPGFAADNSVPELTVIQKDDAHLRINAGCYDFGTENLKEIIEPIIWQGISAIKSEYYSETELKLRKITFNHQGKCFALEMMGENEAEWEELFQLAKTFRFISEDQGE